MIWLRKVIKWFVYLLLIPVVYLVIALGLTAITVNKTASTNENEHEIYLTTNGVHLDIIIPIDKVGKELKKDIDYASNELYFAFGWGDENFYLNTPTWGDLTFSNAFQALFLKSSTLIHLTRYKKAQASWVKVNINAAELRELNQYITHSFQKSKNGKKVILSNRGYASNDDFYKANGSYSCLRTCNTWVNSAFKQCGLKACLWTLFDFGLINKYKK